MLSLKLELSSCLLFIASMATAQPEWLVQEEFLSPAAEQFDCHTSCIIETSPGRYCATWKGGPGEGTSNGTMTQQVGIWASLFEGQAWSDPKEVVQAPKSLCWTPVLCQIPQGDLLLFYRIGPTPRTVVSFLKRSNDGGGHWSEGEMLPAGIVGPTKNRPIISASGALVVPSSVEVGSPADVFKATACWIEISEDEGRHWTKVGPLALGDRPFGVIEPALFLDAQGKLNMFCRDRAHRVGETGYIWRAVSQDEGLHWSALQATTLPNPDSGFDVADLGSGELVLFYNHSHTSREVLHVAVSVDGGYTWSAPLLLSEAGEFPSAMLASDGWVHVTYATRSTDSDQRRIKHVVIDSMKLKAAARTQGS